MPIERLPGGCRQLNKVHPDTDHITSPEDLTSSKSSIYNTQTHIMEDTNKQFMDIIDPAFEGAGGIDGDDLLQALSDHEDLINFQDDDDHHHGMTTTTATALATPSPWRMPLVSTAAMAAAVAGSFTKMATTTAAAVATRIAIAATVRAPRSPSC